MDAATLIALITKLVALLKTQGPTLGAIGYAIYLASQGDYSGAVAALLAAFGYGTVTHRVVQAETQAQGAKFEAARASREAARAANYSISAADSK